MDWQKLYETYAQGCYVFAALAATALALREVVNRPALLDIFRLPAGARDAAVFVGASLLAVALLMISAAVEHQVAGALTSLMLTTFTTGVFAFVIYPVAVADDIQRDRFAVPWVQAVGLGALGFVWSIVSVQLAMAFFGAQMKVNFAFKDVSAQYPIELAAIFFFSMVAAAIEEIIFRGGIQGMLSRWMNPNAAIAITALLWALGHTGYMTPIGAKEAQIFGLGLLFGYSRQKFGLRTAIVMHALNNGLAVVLMLLPGDFSGG